MRNLPGYNSGYDGDDFAQNRVTIWKDFKVGDVRYRLVYKTGSQFIRVNKSIVKDGMTSSLDITMYTQVFKDCYHDALKYFCDDIKSRELIG